MEKIVLTIGGLLEMLTWSDLFFFGAVLILIMLLVYIIYLIKSDSDTEMPLLKEEKMPSTNSETLEDIVNKLETDYEPKPIDLSRYEQEQENTAIISYDELVKKAKNNINYEDNYESGFDDVLIKKVDPTNTSDTKELVNLPKAVMMSYASEEAFLKALKVLQKNLVR